MKRINPVAITPQAIAGRRLPPDWKAQTTGGNYDQRDLENMWRTPQWSAKINSENVQREARLTRHPSWDDLLGER
jgi:hypothetical protein